MEATSHGIRIPGVKILMRTLEGQSMVVGVFENATICNNDIPQAIIKEIGSYCAGSVASGAMAGFLISMGIMSGGWVILAAAAFGAGIAFGYDKLIDFAWHWSLENSMEPVYSVPYLDDIGSVKNYNIDEMWGLSGGRRIANQYKEPQRPRAINECRLYDYRHPVYCTDSKALPDEFFVGRPATPYDFVDITGGIGKKWLVRLDNQKFR